MSSEKYDVRDTSGRKIGTIEPSSGIGPLIVVLLGLFVLFCIIAIPIAMILGVTGKVSSTIHPVMPYTYFPVHDAHTTGAVQYGVPKHSGLPGSGTSYSWSYNRSGAWDKVMLHRGGSIAFVFNNAYSDGEFSFYPKVYGPIGGTRSALRFIVNDNEVYAVQQGAVHTLPIRLNKGKNTIQIVNSDSSAGIFEVSGIRINDKLCSTTAYTFACGNEQAPSQGHLEEIVSREDDPETVRAYDSSSSHRAQVCTQSWSEGEATLYDIGGESAKTRVEIITRSGSKRGAEHFIRRGLVTYTWKNDEVTGWKYSSVPLIELLGIKAENLACQLWAPESTKFDLPKHVRFVTVTEKCPTGCP